MCLCFLAELHTYVHRGVDIASVSSFDPRFLELFFETLIWLEWNNFSNVELIEVTVEDETDTGIFRWPVYHLFIIRCAVSM